MTLYKIFTVEEYDALKAVDLFFGNIMDLDSRFVHLSFEEQLDGILKKFFSEYDTVFVAEIDHEQLDPSKLRVENNPGGKTKYPHYYGYIPQSAFVKFVEKSPQ